MTERDKPETPEENGRVTFAEIVFKCAESKALVAEFDRLTGANLSMKGNGLELMIDEATGKRHDDIAAFVAFVHEFIWLPLVASEPM